LIENLSLKFVTLFVNWDKIGEKQASKNHSFIKSSRSW
jgi:predicted DNA-binding WGR domain protein